MAEIKVYFGVFEFGDDPLVVTRLVGAEPTQAWVKGEALPQRPSGRRTHSRWSLSSPLSPAEPVEDQIAALLPLLEARADGVRAVATQFKAGIMCAMYFDQFTAGVHLPEDLIARIAALKLSLDFDMYFLSESESYE
jgi:hypothetical protein